VATLARNVFCRLTEAPVVASLHELCTLSAASPGSTGFKSQTGTCNYAGMDAAVNSCKTYVAAAMDVINANAYAGTKLKIVSNPLDDTRRQYAFRVIEQQLRLHPVRRHPSDLHRRHGQRGAVRRHDRLGRCALHLVHGRQEPDLEPVRPRAHGLGGVDQQPGGSLTRQTVAWTGRVVLARRRSIRSAEKARGARRPAGSSSRSSSSQAVSPTG
jgi:hypothetical protein